jgi:hypothetical protein
MSGVVKKCKIETFFAYFSKIVVSASIRLFPHVRCVFRIDRIDCGQIASGNSKTNHRSKVKPCFLDVSRRISSEKNRISAENNNPIYKAKSQYTGF